jgi:tetratricopeptide (TPR) repeat protein
MRASGVLLLAALTSSAAAQPAPIGGPPVRKGVTDKFPAEALSKFVDGIIADKAGDYGDALHAYEASNKIAPHANTYYNIADVERRAEDHKDAVEAYRKYLELAPTAPDRAAVEKLIAELEKAPQLITIDGEEPNAVIFVDGKLIGPSPVTLRLPLGTHTADRITATTSSSTHLEIRNGRPQHRSLTHVRKGEQGSVILATGPGWNTGGSWKDKDTGRTWHMPGRNDLPPGRYETSMWNDTRACTKLAFDVAPGDHLTYVYLDAGPRTPEGCLPITVKVQKLQKGLFQ